MDIGRGGFYRFDQAGDLAYTVALGFRGSVRDLPLRGPPATSRSTTGCPSLFGASLDPVHRICFWWNWELRSMWHR